MSSDPRITRTMGQLKQLRRDDLADVEIVIDALLRASDDQHEHFEHMWKEQPWNTARIVEYARTIVNQKGFSHDALRFGYRRVARRRVR